MNGPSCITWSALTSFSLGLGILVAALAVRRLEDMPFTQEGDEMPGELGAPLGMAMVLALLGAGFSQIADSLLGLGLGLAILLLGSRRLVQGRRHDH